MATGMPVAFCFMLICTVGMFVFFGGGAGIEQFILSISSTLGNFNFVAVPMFVLMGEVMLHSGVAPFLMDSLDKWMGRVPGRLSLLAVLSGVLFGTFTGTSMASTAILGSVLVPEMEKRGYKKPMSLGPILGSGGLAMLIPPSGLAVLLGILGGFSIGKILIAIILAGLLLAALNIVYIITRCYLQPSVAPAYEASPEPLSKKIVATVRYVLPLGLVIFLVTGVIFLGIATPSQAAATGAIGTFILAFFYGRMNWETLKKVIIGTVSISCMLFMIIAGATAFGQILAFGGISQGLSDLIKSLDVPPMAVVIIMQVIILILGCFMDVIAIMMITAPIFFPLIVMLGFDPIWFGVVFLLNIEIAGISPPFGMNLFVMKGVAPRDTTMGDIYRAAAPFLGLAILAMVLIMAFPQLALWLPKLMR